MNHDLTPQSDATDSPQSVRDGGKLLDSAWQTAAWQDKNLAPDVRRALNRAAFITRMVLGEMGMAGHAVLPEDRQTLYDHIVKMLLRDQRP